MPVIKVWCLPELSEERLRELHQELVRAVESVKALGLKGEQAMTMLFPKDLMTYGLGTEIIIEVTGLFDKPERTIEVRNELAHQLGLAAAKFFPEAMIECFVYTFHPSRGFWTSAMPRQTPGKTFEPEFEITDVDWDRIFSITWGDKGRALLELCREFENQPMDKGDMADRGIHHGTYGNINYRMRSKKFPYRFTTVRSGMMRLRKYI